VDLDPQLIGGSTQGKESSQRRAQEFIRFLNSEKYNSNGANQVSHPDAVNIRNVR
jgi:hypothetical protein